MTPTELMIAEARERGLRHFFGLPGGGLTLEMVDAGRRLGLELVTVAHESSAAIMAAFHGRMLKTAGLALAVKGVGAGNLAGGAVNAYFERLPVVCACDASPDHLTQREMVQHCDHAGLFGAVAKYQATLTAENAPRPLQDAVFHATDGRPGPVLLNLPAGLGQRECADPLPAKAATSPCVPDPARLAAARRQIRSACRPVVIAGQDVVRAGATDGLLTLVENIGAAVLVNMDARGVVPETHPRWAGVLVGTYGPNIIETEIFRQADLIVLVGADAMMTHSAWGCDVPTCEFVARPEYETLSASPAVRVDGDLKVALEDLLSLRQPGFSEDEIQRTRQKILHNFERPGSARLAAQDILAMTRAALPADGMLFAETGVFVCLLEHLWPVQRPGAFWGTSGGRTMGLMLPAILGARLADPRTPMIGIGGDGSLLMWLGELEVFARTGVGVPLVIMNDRALGTIKSRQKSRRMSPYALDLHPVDYAAIATGMGLNGVTVETPEQFETALHQAMRTRRTTLIDARVDPVPYQNSFGPMIGEPVNHSQGPCMESGPKRHVRIDLPPAIGLPNKKGNKKDITCEKPRHSL